MPFGAARPLREHSGRPPDRNYESYQLTMAQMGEMYSQRFYIWLDPVAADDAALALITHPRQRGDWDAVEPQSVSACEAAAACLPAAAREARLPVGRRS